MRLKFVNTSYFKQLFQNLRPKLQYSKNRIFVTSHFGTLFKSNAKVRLCGCCWCCCLLSFEQAVTPSFFSYFKPTMHAASRHGTPSSTSLPKDGGVSSFGRSSARSHIQSLTVHSRV